MSDTPVPPSHDAAALGPTPTGYQRSQGGTSFKWMPPSTDHLAKLMPQYNVEALVGRGGMGAVYKGKQKTLDRTVAIKILPPEVDDEDASYTERFKNEAKIMARLEHPAIVPVYDFGETSEGQLYFVMGFVNGTDVHQMIQSQGRLPPEHALAITAHVCDALHYAHAHGVIHRDIKPSNVLINMDGQVKVADFGLAKMDDPAQSSGLTQAGIAMGTPDYVAPETLTVGVQADGRADLYAVGVMLYQMLTGRVPRGTFDPPSKLTGCDPRFDQIVFKAMKYDRDERYATAADLRRDLDVILTTPLVQAGGQSSAAIPQNALPPKPVAKGPQKPGPKPATSPANQKSEPNAARQTAARSSKGSEAHQIANQKSKSPLFLGLGAAAAAVIAFITLSGEKPKPPAEPPQSALNTQVTKASERSAVAPPLPTPKPTTPPPASTTKPAIVETKPAPKPSGDGLKPGTTLPEPKAAPAVKQSSPALERVDASPAPGTMKSDATTSGASASAVPTKVKTTFPPGQWVKVFTKFEDLPEELRKPEKGMKFEDGWLLSEVGKPQRIYVVDSLSNYAIRATARRQGKEYQGKMLMIRAEPKGGYKGYTLAVGDGHVYAGQKVDGSSFVDSFWKAQAPDVHLPRIGDEYTLEFGCVGNKLIGRLGNEFVKVITDSKRDQGPGFFTGGEPIRDIEVINLDGLPEAEALRLLGVDEKGNDLRALAAKQEQQKAEQAKQADTIAAIPELKTLNDAFVKLQAERVVAPFDADLAKLNTSYLGGLDREIAKEKQKGHLDGVLVLEAEQKLIQGVTASSRQPGGERRQDAVTPCPVPAEDDDQTPDNLKSLRKTYRDAFTKLDTTRATNLKSLTAPLTLRLKQLESTLTQQNRIDHAKTVREYRESLGTQGIAGTPSGSSQTGGETAKSTDAEKNSRAPLKKFPPGDDRKAAEWAIDLGGWVRILEGKNERRIDKKEDLPKRSFEIIALKLSSASASKRVIDFTDLKPMAGLRHLSNIDLSGMPVTDTECDVFASLPELARLTISKTDTFTGSQLGKLKHLGKLTYLYLGETGITAEGVAAIGELTDLEYLRLTPTKFGDADVAPLVKLKKLSSLLMGRGQLTLDGWKKLKGLFIKDYLGFTPQAGQMQTWCAELVRLFPAAHHLEVACDDALAADDIAALGKFSPTRLTLSNPETNDAVVAAVCQFSKLEYLNLANGPKASGLPGVTDASLTALAAHKTLSLISLTDVRGITADGLLKLARLKTLKTLELIRCRQLDDAAIDAMKKARPDVTVSVE